MVITVTGATGTIGTELVRLLSTAHVPVRAVSRSGSKLPRQPGVVWTQADLHDRTVLEPALAGTTRLFLLSSNEAGFGALQTDVVQTAERLGVTHVVKLSALGASDHSKSSIAREHWTVEQALQQTGMTWTILRPHAFMQNWLGEVAESARGEGKIYSAIEDGRVPFIDARDIAAVAVEALLHPETHSGQRYFLTGGSAVGYRDLAEALTELTGRTITYQPITLDEARLRMESRGVAPAEIAAMLAIEAYQKAGGPTSVVSDKVERILGRPPRTIQEFARDYAAYFGELDAPEAP